MEEDHRDSVNLIARSHSEKHRGQKDVVRTVSLLVRRRRTMGVV